MKLHDLRPADGSRQPRTRVGRGIAAGKGKTAGRGTKGQKARAGGSIAPWFEGGQTPLHQRIPKLRGFKNRFKIEYEVVNVGAIGSVAERGAFETDTSGKKGAKPAPITVNQDILRAVGLVRTLNKPLKILGAGELSVPLFVVADAFTASARAKIEAAGGSVNVLEMPSESRSAVGVDGDAVRTPREPRTAAGRAAAGRRADARDAGMAEAAEAAAVEAAKAAKPPTAPKAPKAPKAQNASSTGDAPSAVVPEIAEVPEPAEIPEPAATPEPSATSDASEAGAEADAPDVDA
jgi:large subunit ribosomal protein L15